MQLQEALAALAAMDAELHVLGAVDSEHHDIARLRQQLLNEELPPTEVVARAQRLLNSRSEYH